MKKLFFICFVVFGGVLYGQAPSEAAKMHTFNSIVFGKERTLRVVLPPDYQKEKSKKYNVVYVLDGSWDARVDYIAGSINFLDAYGQFPSSIVVGVSSDDRTYEFTPKPVLDETTQNWGDRKIGGAPLLQEFFKTEVFPLISAKYRVTNFKTLVGHSLGGTFGISDLAAATSLFHAYVVTSPNLDYDGEEIIEALEKKVDSKNELNAFLYVSIGTEGGMEKLFTPGVKRLDGLMAYKKVSKLRYFMKTNSGLDHGSTPLVGTLEGLMALGAQWSMSDAKKQEVLNGKIEVVEGFKKHYSSLEDWSGSAVIPTATDVNNLGYFVLNNGQTAEAVKVFSWALELHPNDANLYDSKGEALEKDGKAGEALAFYEKALALLEKNKDSYGKDEYDFNKGIYLKNINRTKQLR